MRTIIAGSRSFTNYELFKEHMKNEMCFITTIISGGACGVDYLGECLAKEFDIPLEIYKAEWAKYGKSAGYKRNQLMADKADRLIAWWDGESKGTKHMIDIAKKKKMPITLFYTQNVEQIYRERF
jgi:RNAse (barnase) inhibitor barstar